MVVIFSPHCEKLEEPILIRVLTHCAVRDLQRTDVQMRLRGSFEVCGIMFPLKVTTVLLLSLEGALQGDGLRHPGRKDSTVMLVHTGPTGDGRHVTLAARHGFLFLFREQFETGDLLTFKRVLATTSMVESPDGACQ